MGFNGAPKPTIESNEKPKNRLNLLRSPTESHAMTEVRNFFHQEWYEANKEKLGNYEQLTDAQSQERDRYVDGIEISRIREVLNQVIFDKDTLPENKKEYELLRVKLSLP